MKYKHKLSTRQKWILACTSGALLSLFLALELHLVFTGYLIDVGSRGFFKDIQLCTQYYGFRTVGRTAVTSSFHSPMKASGIWKLARSR